MGDGQNSDQGIADDCEVVAQDAGQGLALRTGDARVFYWRIVGWDAGCHQLIEDRTRLPLRLTALAVGR